MTNIPIVQPENTSHHNNKETPAGSPVFGPHLPSTKHLGIVEFHLEHVLETMELLLHRSYKNSYQNRNPTDGGAHLETASGPRELPPTKDDRATNNTCIDTLQAVLDNVTQRLNSSRSANHDFLVTDLPFTKKIIEADLPDKFKLPYMDHYNGCQDLADNLETYRAHMTLQASFNAIIFWAFPLTLIEAAKHWFKSLQP